jgi:hypothetical protein
MCLSGATLVVVMVIQEVKIAELQTNGSFKGKCPCAQQRSGLGLYNQQPIPL